MGRLRIILRPGDVVIDRSTGDIGLLVFRYDILYDQYLIDQPEGDEPVIVWAWEIYWTGSKFAKHRGSRYQSYTEFGLENMIETGTMLIIVSVCF